MRARSSQNHTHQPHFSIHILPRRYIIKSRPHYTSVASTRNYLPPLPSPFIYIFNPKYRLAIDIGARSKLIVPRSSQLLMGTRSSVSGEDVADCPSNCSASRAHSTSHYVRARYYLHQGPTTTTAEKAPFWRMHGNRCPGGERTRRARAKCVIMRAHA